MGWAIISGAAILVAGLIIWLGKMPRGSWELLGAALCLGIAGYAWQGHPSDEGAPKQAIENIAEFDEELADQRSEMGSTFGDARAWLVLADAQSRQGKFASAATVLRKGLETHPEDPDLWVALGNALVGHANGMLSPAAQFAYQKAASIDPEHPAPPFFLGLALATSGQFDDARAIWAELLARTPEDAGWREDLEQRIARLDAMMQAQGAMPMTPSPDAGSEAAEDAAQP